MNTNFNNNNYNSSNTFNLESEESLFSEKEENEIENNNKSKNISLNETYTKSEEKNENQNFIPFEKNEKTYETLREKKSSKKEISNLEKNLNFKRNNIEQERPNFYNTINAEEEEFFVKYLKEKIKNDQPIRILNEVCQKAKYNVPEIIINTIGKNDQFSVKIFISDFFFFGEGLAQSKKEGKSNFLIYIFYSFYLKCLFFSL